MSAEAIPKPCDTAIFKGGAHVAAIAQGGKARSWHIEDLIARVAEKSGTVGKTDWHYSGGIAQVLTLGDLGKVAEALRSQWPEFVKVWPDAQIRLGGPALYRAGDSLPEDVIAVDSAAGVVFEDNRELAKERTP